jgi:hypothetical protein
MLAVGMSPQELEPEEVQKEREAKEKEFMESRKVNFFEEKEDEINKHLGIEVRRLAGDQVLPLLETHCRALCRHSRQAAGPSLVASARATGPPITPSRRGLRTSP